MKKFLKITFYTLIIIFALIGFGLTAAYLAVKFHLTDDPGNVDINDRLYQEMANKDFLEKSVDTNSLNKLSPELAIDYLNVLAIAKFYPYNAKLLIDVLNNNSNNIENIHRIIYANSSKLLHNKDYVNTYSELKSIYENIIEKDTLDNLYEWMNISEWSDLKMSITKDKKVIDSACNLAGVEPRIVVCCLIGEQIRLYNSEREIYKKVIGPLKILSVENNFSLGITGMKDFTAKKIERNLIDPSSEFYLGKKYENILGDVSQIGDSTRYYRFVNTRNHFYQYLYTALYLKQIKVQWERNNCDISNRPEILTTLYNIGFNGSKPKPNPQVGGANVKIHDKTYSFGSIGFDFYYSGELQKEFPYLKQKFWD
jgi:hypothetical protein